MDRERERERGRQREREREREGERLIRFVKCCTNKTVINTVTILEVEEL